MVVVVVVVVVCSAFLAYLDMPNVKNSIERKNMQGVEVFPGSTSLRYRSTARFHEGLRGTQLLA